MNKLKIVYALLLIVFLGMGYLGPSVRVSLARSQNETTQVASSFVPGRLLVQFRPDTTKSRGRRLIAQAGASDVGEIPGTGVHILELPAGADEEIFMHAFKSQPEVAVAELDRILPPEGVTPNDPWYPNEWHLSKISASIAWATTTGSSSVTVAILDTGVDGTHPDLAANLMPGWNIYDNNSNTSDVIGHGTAVAGTVAALSNNGTGVASIAWGCRLMPIRISDLNGNAAYSAAASGLTWAADHGARVANISYIMTDSSAVTSAASYFQSKGGVVTISAGNYATFDSSPDNPYVLTVSGITGSDVIWSSSNTGNNVDLCAPYYVYTTVKGGGYSGMVGTSGSAPIVAGVAALVLSANPGLTASQVQNILKQSADDLGSAGWDSSYGCGRVNAANAVALAGATPPADATPPSVSIASPSNGATISGSVSVQVSASDNVGVASVSLNLDGVIVGNATSAPYTFPWNTTTVSNGAHTLIATARDAAGNTANSSVSVIVSNSVPDTTPPVVSITSPTGGNVSGSVFVLVSATDNVGVVKVNLYVDGALVSTATSSPFTNRWNTRKAVSGAHTLQCKAYDAAGNLGASSIITVYK